MAEFPTCEQMAKEVAEKALDEFLYDGKSIREWIKIIAEQEPTTKNDLGVDCISRIETIEYLCKHCPDDGECFKDCDEIKHLRQLPSVTPQEPITWIVGKNNAQIAVKNMPIDKLQKICAIIGDEQEPKTDIEEKIHKMKSEIADSLEFWDYFPNNNPLARDMLETITNFWGEVSE